MLASQGSVDWYIISHMVTTIKLWRLLNAGYSVNRILTGHIMAYMSFLWLNTDHKLTHLISITQNQIDQLTSSLRLAGI